MTITWSANSEGDLSGYYVYRSTSSGGTFALLATVGAVTTYTNTGLSGATNYYYKIAAFDTSSFESAATAEATGKTMAVDSGGIMGGGGGGGGAPVSVYTVIPGTGSSASSAAGTTASSVSSTATVVVTKPITLPGGLIVALTKTLKLGSENSEVKALQKALRRQDHLSRRQSHRLLRYHQKSHH